MSVDDLLPCRKCFWAADVTRDAPKVWCAHAGCHGWMTDLPACGGGAFVKRRPWHHSIEAFERHAGVVGG